MAEDMFAQKGWICPKCGRVLAPSMMYCLWCCSDMKETITTTTTSIPKWDTTPITVGNGYMTAEQTEDYRKMLDKAKHKVYGNIEDEPQTYITEDRDTQILDAWQVHHRTSTTAVEDEPQTERSE